MFASCGHFRTVSCPFFASGLCHRPYCHFKHAPELKPSAATAAAVIPSGTTIVASVPHLLSKSCDGADEHEPSVGSTTVAASAAPVRRTVSQPSYTPTPRQLLPAAAKSAQQQLTYRPTPICELRAAAVATPTVASEAPLSEEAGAGQSAAAASAASPAVEAQAAAGAASGAVSTAFSRRRSAATDEYDPEANYRTPAGLVEGGARRRSSDVAECRPAGIKGKPLAHGSSAEPSAPTPCHNLPSERDPEYLSSARSKASVDVLAPAAAAVGEVVGQQVISRTVAKVTFSDCDSGRSPAIGEPESHGVTPGRGLTSNFARAGAPEGERRDEKCGNEADAARSASAKVLSTGNISRVTFDRGVETVAAERLSEPFNSKIFSGPKTDTSIAEATLATAEQNQLLGEEPSSTMRIEGKGTSVPGKFRLKEVRVVLSRLAQGSLHVATPPPRKHAKRRLSSSSSSSASSEHIDDSQQDSEPQAEPSLHRSSKQKSFTEEEEEQQLQHILTRPISSAVSQLRDQSDSIEDSPVVNRTKDQRGAKRSKVSDSTVSGSSSTVIASERRSLQTMITSSEDRTRSDVRLSSEFHPAEKANAHGVPCSSKLYPSLGGEKSTSVAPASDPQQQAMGATATAQPALGDSMTKKRIAHNIIPGSTKNVPSTIKTVPPPPARKPTPAEVLQSRYEILRTKAAAARKDGSSSECAVSEGDKATAAAVPGRTVGPLGQAPACSERPTVGKTTKSEPRKAHQPPAAVGALLSRPRVKADGNNSKVPLNLRQSVLDRLVDEAVQTCTSVESAYERAVREEASAYARSGTKDVYRNLMAAAIKKLRDERASGPSECRSVDAAATAASAGATAGAQRALACGRSSLSVQASCPTYSLSKGSAKSAIKPAGAAATSAVTPVSHDQVLLGKAHGNVTLGLKKKEKNATAEITINTLKGPVLCDRLLRYVLTEDQLLENGYPRPAQGAVNGTALIKWSEKYDKRPQTAGEKKCCVRCGKMFAVLPGCIYAKPEEGCSYHWGRRIKKKVTGQIEAIYTCCQGSGNAEACVSAKCHVYDSNKYDDVTGFIETPKKSSAEIAAYAIDCEMVYTTAGIELARVTLIDDNLKEVFDAIVCPSFPIVDCNTRFSGLTEDSFRGVTTTFTQARCRLFDFINARTILIGHSMENDLRTLKIFHNKVVDTSVVFPHRMGPPAKRALRDLVAENLMKIIQDDGDTGHDSAADARACMELMKWKVLQDLKKDSR